MRLRSSLLLVAIASAFGCSSAKTPLPKGPPPEYEAPRAFDAGAADRAPGTPAETEAPDAPQP